MKRIMMASATALALAGCSAAGDFSGSVHGYIVDTETALGLSISALPTIMPDGTEPLGYERSSDGTARDAFSTLKTPEVNATGLTANILACAADPDCIRAALGQ